MLQDTSMLQISTSPWHSEIVITLHDPPKAAAGDPLLRRTQQPGWSLAHCATQVCCA